MRDPFEGMSRSALAGMIDDARLSSVDTQIARMRLLDRAYYSDIGAAVGYDRRTVARRMTGIMDALGKG